MCGIAGIINFDPNRCVDHEELHAIRDYMYRRGPDGKGSWFSPDKNVGLAHRRLSIIDTSKNAHQPMISSDKRYIIVFNGEIYNFHELRNLLLSEGYRFNSNSDTEVLLNLFSFKKEAMFDLLEGMYAFAIWDCKDERILIARDPFGIKPLYFSETSHSFYFASQVKALLVAKDIPAERNPAGYVGFYCLGHVPEPHTLYKQIKAFPPGEYMYIDRYGHKRNFIFCSIKDEIQKSGENARLNFNGNKEVLYEALSNTTRKHLISDVPLGVFLSAGLDSSTITAFSREHSADLITLTLGFSEYAGTENDESAIAIKTADYYQTRHHTIFISSNAFHENLDQFISAMDQPSIDGVNSFFICQAAAKAGLKVVLSGLGGDELFWGYPSFSQVPNMVQVFGWLQHFPKIGEWFRKMSLPFLGKVTSPKYAGLLELGGCWEGAYFLRRGLFMPWELDRFMEPKQVLEGWENLSLFQTMALHHRGINCAQLKVSSLEMNNYMRNQLLRDSDWASMAHSIELRVPFIDLPLLKAVIPFLVRNKIRNKKFLSEMPPKPLPGNVVNRRKTGFTVPFRDWFLMREGSANYRGLRGWADYIIKRFDG
jgi:asparagine synthase (glutamine-hydrolysing)